MKQEDISLKDKLHYDKHYKIIGEEFKEFFQNLETAKYLVEEYMLFKTREKHKICDKMEKFLNKYKDKIDEETFKYVKDFIKYVRSLPPGIIQDFGEGLG